MQTLLQIAGIVGTILAAVIAALIAQVILLRVIKKVSAKIEDLPDNSFAKNCGGAVRWLFIFLAIYLVGPVIVMPERITQVTSHIIVLILIALFSAVLIKLTYVFDDYILHRFRVDVSDNLRARKVQTQLNMLRRIFTTIVILIAVASMLMTFEQIRALGTAILASAGIVGIVVGMAAQKTIGTFIAGLQIAITQPISIDDVVIVENEWGKIEEVTLTYVVVRIWDLRRLIVPISYFIEKPFQNWTRVSADLLGTVFLYVDYTVPTDTVRRQLQEILEKSPFWDKKVSAVQVTNTSERTVELRALMSASNSSNLWELRCEVREKLIEFIGKNYPASLPKLRTEFEKPETVKESRHSYK